MTAHSPAAADSAALDERFVAARSLALRMVERQPRTRVELARALRRRGVPDDTTEEVLDRFTDVGLIDDDAFAAAWVDSRHRGRGLARRALAEELRTRGVDGDVAAQALAAVSDDDERVAARSLVERRLRSMRDQPREVKLRRLTAMLARKGFGGAVARRVISDALQPTLGEPGSCSADRE